MRDTNKKKNKQLSFAQDVKLLTETIEEMGNPFSKDSCDLVPLDRRDITDVALSEAIRTIQKFVLELYEKFVEKRLLSNTILLSP